MKQTSTHTKDTFIIRCLLLLFVLTNMVAVSVTAHNVTGYTPSCGSGPQYSVTAAVTNVNSTSNYRWQWKNPSGSWICFVNGTNNINGISYNVSGAVYNLTTNPGPIIFTNPDIGLNGLEIRMVISDGSGVDPCTLPSGNTWTSSTNLIINVAGTSCGAAVNIGNLVWWDKNDNGIKDASEAGWPWALNVNLYRDQDQNGVADAGWVTRTVAIDGNGNYNFTNVPAGNYFVTLTNPYPNDWFKSSVNAGDPDNDIDNDNNGVNSLSSNAVIAGLPISLTLGGEPATGVDGDGTNGNLTYDFGLWKGNGLGDYVWLDDNANGIQDAGESGISGVTVTLSKGATTYTTTTDASGYYFFADIYDLANGGYTLTFTTPSGLTPSPSNQGSDDAKDSDPVGGVISSVTVPIGTWNHTFDAGFVRIGSIGNRVWEDVNKNGIQDGTEVGVSGITVSLYNAAGTLVATTVTDGYGNYLFTNLPVGAAGSNYQVRFSLPPQYVVTPQSQGSDITIDSDPATNTGRTSNILLTTANKDRVDVDAGIYYSIPARIGDFIWNDANKNGIQDAGEPGIAGVTVTLYNNAGVAVRSTITDNNGYYLFTDVPAGNYTLGITPPVGYVVTGKDFGSDDAKDSDFDPLTFKTGTFTVVNGTSNLTFDGGLYVTPTTVAAVGDKVWNDLNANNLQDSNEPGVSGVTVQLYTGAGVLVATQVTDVFGNYMFNNLTPGSYYVKFSNLPSGYVLVAANQGGVANYQIDSDVTGANGTGTTATFSLVADETKVTVDAGIRNPSVTANSSLGDYVWYDLNKNGIQDAGEAGVPGVTATLYNATTNAVLATTTTDGSGLYLFTDLAIGSYKVGFTNLPAGYIFSAKDQGADDNIDSDVDPNTGITGSYNIAANGTTIRTVDAGIKSDPNVRIGKASLGDKVWNDINNNGIQDAGEPGVPGVTVTLYAADGTTVIATTTTDGFGNYIFTNLDAGTYVVGFSGLPAGYVFGTKDAGTDDGKDSDADVSTGKSGQVTLAAGEVNLTIDAGIKASVTKSSLGDKVWYDNNNNGIQDAGEMGVKGVSVTLYNTGNAFLSTTSTDANGYYLFTNLDAGSYIVGFSNLPAGYTPTTQNASGGTTANNSDANVSTGKTATITLAASTSDLTWDMGIVTTARAAVGDYVWSDLNNNGIQDAGEPAVSGITVTLYNSAGTAIASTVTDANGYYMFNNIIPATGFTIGFSNIPANSSFTTKNASGSTTANNSDVNTATGRTDAFNLVAGQIKTDVDAGLITLFAAVGDYVWYDTNANGKQDAGEVGVPGVTVKLYDVNGNVVASAVTDGNGKYFINNIPVPAGGSTFTIGFSDLPINATGWTLKNAPGTTAANNSDVNAANGRTDAFVLLPGSIDLTRDGGIITSGGGPLPLTFTNLKGVYNNGVSNLSWASLSEQNFSHFEVEYSTNGVNFSYIGRVNGAGNSSSKIDYAYAHKQPVAGVNYYRLKMVDKDGRYTYSNVVALNVTIKGINITGAYPNPFVDKVNITLSADVTDKALVRIFDATGKVVISNENKIQRGTAVITITNLAKLAQGMYVIEVRIADKVFTQKLIK